MDRTAWSRGDVEQRRVSRGCLGTATLPLRAHRREPQSAQSRGAALQGDSGIHRQARKPLRAAHRDALQQDVPRSFSAATPLYARRPRPGCPPGVSATGLGEWMFQQRHQCGLRTLAAFEKSEERRRLARSDAPLPYPPDAQLHPGELCRDRRREGRTYLTLEMGCALLLPRAHPAHAGLPCG